MASWNANSTFAVYAVKYARRDALRSEHFYGQQSQNEPMPIDFFVWAAVSPEHTVVVDTGFTAEVAARRFSGEHLRCPSTGLTALGIDCSRVGHVVLTHLHFDHAGNLALFPAAKFVVQDDELAFWTGRYISREGFHTPIELDDILSLVRANFDGRVRFVDGSGEVVSGVTVHRVGGHSRALQVVRVNTARGAVVLASDAAHFYASIEEDRPHRVLTDLAMAYGAIEAVRALADSPAHIIPGHDPLVMERFPAVPGLEGIAVRVA